MEPRAEPGQGDGQGIAVQHHARNGLTAGPVDPAKGGAHFNGACRVQCQMTGLSGGGEGVRPGEVSLAHLGILFLDELPEFQRVVLDSLRQPLETGEVSVARANSHVTFPARVQLVAAMNPCRCGHLGDAALACSRAPRCAADYQSKVSGPLLDRIDLHVEVEAVSADGSWRKRR